MSPKTKVERVTEKMRSYRASVDRSCRGGGALVFLWTIFLLASMASLPCDASYIVTVKPKTEECFGISSPLGPSTLFGNFDLIDDNLTPGPMSVVILDASNDRNMYRSARNIREGMFKLQLNKDQKVNICVRNGVEEIHKNRHKQNSKRHDGFDRTVGLQFDLDQRDENLELRNQNSKLIGAATSLARELGNLQDHHDYMRAREAKHRSTVEGTFSQLLGWALLEGAVVVLVAGGQILYFQRFLERRHYM